MHIHKKGLRIAIGFFIGWTIASFFMFEEIRWENIMIGLIGALFILMISLFRFDRN
ncbi:hypothetical protein ACSVDE_02700 [Pseudalkalibacillus sp. Hm43]|uniref:hypothetical protein n=1 Tax=Pseudalkalibacillus sp. Hm43 TaxID=3450742 RepID=UPI003F43CD41